MAIGIISWDLLWVVGHIYPVTLTPQCRLRNTFTHYQPINSGPFVSPQTMGIEPFLSAANFKLGGERLWGPHQQAGPKLFPGEKNKPSLISSFCFMKCSPPGSLSENLAFSSLIRCDLNQRTQSHYSKSALIFTLAVCKTHLRSFGQKKKKRICAEGLQSCLVILRTLKFIKSKNSLGLWWKLTICLM